MENRFGIKDFLIVLLIGAVMVLVGLTMIQVDRQWKTLNELKAASNEQGHDLIQIRRQLAEGVSVGTASAATTQASAATGVDPFKPIAEAEKMPGFARGDWLVENFGAKLKNMTPFIATDVPAAIVESRVAEPLMYRDVDTLEFTPLLAKSWTTSPDGLTITFQLRKGVTFSDGEPMTASDVVFTFDWIRNPAINAPRERSGMTDLDTVKALDDFTVEFKFKKFYFRGLEVVGSEPVLPKHFYSKFKPEDYNQSTGLLMGTGPYKLADPASWHPGMQVELLRNDRYWGTQPAFNRLEYLEVEEEAAEQTMFSNGQMDIFACTPEQYVRLRTDPKILSVGNPLDYNLLLGGYSYIGWNERRKNEPTVFADKKVRQAMTMLIDRESLAKNVYLGFATVATGPFASDSKQLDRTVKPWPYDPNRARKQLLENGFVDRNGTLIKPDGQPFSFKLTYPNKSATYERMVLQMKDSLAKAGIELQQDPVDWPLLQSKLDNKDYDAIFLRWSGAIDDDPYQMFDSSQIADQGDNTMSYASPACDAALSAARACVDPEQRLLLWHKVHQILADECPYSFLLNTRATTFYNKRLHNVRKATMGTNYNRLDGDPISWFVPTDQQLYQR